MPRHIALSELGPTQLYLSSGKLSDVFEWFDFDDPNYGTLPAFEHGGKWYLSDGHSRAFVANLAGVEEIQIHRDENIREEYDFDVYLECIRWCEDAGVETVRDLAGRVVEPETFEAVWVARCQALAD